MKNWIKITIITACAIAFIGATAYFGSKSLYKKRILVLVPVDSQKDVSDVLDKCEPMELVHLFNFFESVHLKVKLKDMSPDLLTEIKKISDKYNYDLTHYGN